MILDTLENLSLYAAVHPLFQAVVDFLKENDLQSLAPGRHDIIQNKLYVNIQEAAPKGRAEARLESHRRMIDIQIPITNGEEMGYTPLCDLQETPYDEADDIAFYEDTPQSYFIVMPGEFVVFFPQDGHAPAISEGGLRKAIFKVEA